MPLTSPNQAFKEFKAGSLHSGPGGPKVTSRKQAVAIALSVKRRQGGSGKPPAAPKGMSK